MADLISPLFLLSLFINLKLAASKLMLDSSYTVSTVLDCNKQLPGVPDAKIHPFSLLPRSESLLLLDSHNSSFYSLPLPGSKGGEVRLFAGKGGMGFSDGGPEEAMFSHPNSFTMDDKGNVYVAERSTRAIRKISKSGVTTTIAGGYSQGTGHIDGPAQNASFSSDFDLVYVPKICSLLISDRGNRLIRQINLKPEDCVREFALGVAPVSIIAALCILFGSVVGFFARQFFSANGVSIDRFINKTWKHYQARLWKPALTTCSGIINAVVNFTPFILVMKLFNLSPCYLSIVFQSLTLEKRVQRTEAVSLLDSDVSSNREIAKPQIFADHLKDVISLDSGVDGLVVNESSKVETEMKYASHSSFRKIKIDDMIRANLLDFTDHGKQQGQIDVPDLYSNVLVRRRPMEFDGS